MKSRGKTTKMLRLWLLCGWGPLVLNAVEDSDNGFLRRKQNKSPDGPIADSSTADDAQQSTGPKMEDLWEQAARALNVDLNADRLLMSRSSGDFSMSMPMRPTHPTRPPIHRPTPAPISRPTPRPNPLTTPAPNPRPTPAPVDGPTQAPVDCLMGRTREEYIFDLLAPITSGRLLNDPSTPQGMAFDYLANDDPGLENPCVSSTIEQRYGLTTLYFSTQGEGWLESGGWLGAEQECNWVGVSCLNENDPMIVSKLLVSNNNLIGSIPNEMLTLEKIQRLDMFSNAITGTLPEGASKLTDLILLDLEQNLLTGLAFPPALFDMRSLLAYRISDNFVSGTIAREIGNLQNLEQLWVATNQLTGTLPTQLASPPNLESIFLYENQIIGSLPSQLGSLTNLEDLRLYSNTLQLGIPSELFSATNLISLQLGLNFFSGTLPSEIGQLENLLDLRLDTNSLSGALPTEIGRLTLLENMILNNNFLSGQIPNMFGDYERLDFFDVSNNIFFGSIPESLFEVGALRLCYMSNNTLSGTVPPEYGKAPLLRDLWLDGNGLIGTVPPIQRGELQGLNEFLLQFNFLTGSMPDSICDLRGNDGNLDDLFSDCGGQNPEIVCAFPQCCNRCFEGGNFVRRRAERRRTNERHMPRR